MPCKNLQRQLPLFAGRELDAVQSAVVDEHLKSCPDCRANAAAFVKTKDVLNRYGRDLAQGSYAPDLFPSLRPRLSAGADVKPPVDIGPQSTEPFRG